MPHQVPFEATELTNPYKARFPTYCSEVIEDWYKSHTILTRAFAPFPDILAWYEDIPTPSYISAFEHPTFFPEAPYFCVGDSYNAWREEIVKLVRLINDGIYEVLADSTPNSLPDYFADHAQGERIFLQCHLRRRNGLSRPEHLDINVTAAVLYRVGHTLPSRYQLESV